MENTMENTITFKNLVKLIHPDVSNVSNASEKMATAVKFRFNPEYLYKKAVEWGVIKTNTEKVVKKYKTVYLWVWRQFGNENVFVGDYIFVATRNIRVKVIKKTAKRYYFYSNGVKTFCGKKNGVLTKEVKVSRKVWVHTNA